jgi:hypothetical protein
MSIGNFETCHVPQSSRFSLRIGYAGWLLHLRRGEPVGFAEIGRAVGRTGQAVSGWFRAPHPPVDYRVHAALAGFLGVDADWLVRDAGDPPRPELWAAWTATRKDDQPLSSGRVSDEEVAIARAERDAKRPSAVRKEPGRPRRGNQRGGR